MISIEGTRNELQILSLYRNEELETKTGGKLTKILQQDIQKFTQVYTGKMKKCGTYKKGKLITEAGTGEKGNAAYLMKYTRDYSEDRVVDIMILLNRILKKRDVRT
jgi:hypothetical protein